MKEEEVLRLASKNTKSSFIETLSLSNKFLSELNTWIILIAVVFAVKTTLLEIYIVPTGSMENEILIGDVLIGNKFVYGMRTPIWIGIPYTRYGFDIPWFRLPSFKKVENGDVVIFEFPRDTFQKYVKRCIGIPGDTIAVINQEIYINNQKMDNPENLKLVRNSRLDSNEIGTYIFPYFSKNMDHIDSFVVPFKGMEINLSQLDNFSAIITLLVQDGANVELDGFKLTLTDPAEIARTHAFLRYKIEEILSQDKYKTYYKQKRNREIFKRKLIRKNIEDKIINPWNIPIAIQQKINDLEYLANNLLINGVPISEYNIYKLKKDYYFFMGDNRDESYDSRFWGFVPENQILGIPQFNIMNISKFQLNLRPVE